MPWLEANGASLRYQLSGTGNKTLVLVHEVGGCLESYEEAAPGFEKDFRVLRYDQRGFGFSEKVRELHFDGVVEDLRGLLDGLNITEPVYLAGCAMGGDISVGFAARYPERVARLAIASCRMTSVDAKVSAARMDRADTFEREGMRACMQVRHDNSYREDMRALDRERFRRYQLRWVCNDPESMAAQARMMTTINLNPLYAQIKAPTLVIGSQHDPLRTPAMSKLVAEAIPGARFVVADTGHFMAVQTPQVFVDTVLPFMKGE